MAKETKVGLLAGLGFIICFAVILTNKGGPSRSAGRTTLADAGRSAVPSTAARPAPARSPKSTRRNPAAAQPRTIPTGSSRTIPALHVPPQQAAPRNRTQRPGAGGRNTNRMQDHQAATPGPAGSPTQVPTTSRMQTPLTSVPGDSNADTGEPNQSTQQRGAPSTFSVDRPEPRHSAPKLPPQPSAVHVVSAGETLSKIAARYYGKGTRANIDRLVAANPVALANPDVIRVGMKLEVPGVAVAASGTADNHRSRTSQQTKRDERAVTPAGATRWYQIRKGDRYIDIARNELGDASRWEEIYELNVEKFPDPGNIREGVRIKLPARESRVARGGRR